MAKTNRPAMESAVIDLEAVTDESDYEVNFADVSSNAAFSERKKKDPSIDKSDNGVDMASSVTSMMFQAGRERARKVFNVYGNIDMLRPYFDVDPSKVRERLIQSFIPQRPTTGQQQPLPRELYGPLMIVFTLVALLLFQMKLADHSVQEGTLMGSAFAVCFGYWLGLSALVWLMAYVANSQVTMVQILSLLGYGLFGHCVVLFLGTVFHTGHDHAIFYLLWIGVGGLATLRMVSVLINRTTGGQKLALCGVLAFIHMVFLLYLHFSYHQVVEELSFVLQKPQLGNAPMLPTQALAVVEADRPVLPLGKAPELPALSPAQKALPHPERLFDGQESLKRVVRETGGTVNMTQNFVVKSQWKVLNDTALKNTHNSTKVGG